MHSLRSRRKYEGWVDGRIGNGEINLPADVRPEDARLPDRLVGAGLAKLRRTICREQNQRHAVRVSFDDGGKAVGDGRAARRNPNRRLPRGTRKSERRERSAPLVEMCKVVGTRVLGNGNRQRRAA